MAERPEPRAFGNCELDTARRELRVGGRLSEIEPKAFDLLTYLMAERERVVSHNELMDVLWPDVIVTEAALARTVMKARKAVGDDARQQAVIWTLPKRGYRFVAELADDEVTGAVSGEGEPVGLSPRGYMAARIPGAQFRLLEGDDHWWFLGDRQSVLDAIGEFIRELPAS